ncbi:MAG: protocatechuate 3,4-dioxygenase subunit beta [Armatimonadota bacterium]|nr:protocatechuate 3,4-dioxygenase subunit beta [Armatimonadota bacterium]MDR7449608.1 protocatechuate 3,4-dioxygenase subunit beta [Armatimonadota bacterium]MDR7460353.1 protocatechuate 3,4-dioxygenase subunit beta [Armatimonadota bacterium]MDR7488086.1 protocatechuate 3,4-dioxygenase subunit beta [Armatimonadota bacterium]MDR7492121.1 protocatechuate 3,4-dioxygenase subunit beta [Armatimonadota bacterium]
MTTVTGRGRHATFPPYLYEAYRATVRRAPLGPLLPGPRTLSEVTGPGPAVSALTAEDSDLTRNAGTGGEAIGERIIVTGRVLDDEGNPVPHTLVEIWQANAAGRYRHRRDQHHAPLDPNFLGFGRCLTDAQGVYRFVTVRPGAYPWDNHENAWRPAHIHFSLLGPTWASRLVTQMFFPGDPLLEQDPIFNAVPTDDARERLIARYAHDVTEPAWALGFRFDIVLRGPEATPFEPPEAGAPWR